MPGEHYDSIAAKTPQSYVRADSRYLPVSFATGVGLTERDDVTSLYAVCILTSGVRHSF